MPLILTIATAFLLTYFAPMELPIKVICYVFLAVALLLATEPLVMRHAPLW